MSPVDYNKWEKVNASSSDENSGDEGSRPQTSGGTVVLRKPGNKQPARPLLDSNKSDGQRRLDEIMYQRYLSLFEKHLKESDADRRSLLARFIAVQHKGHESSNIYRYSDITGLAAQRLSELMDKESISMLCELHKRMVNEAKSDELNSEARQLEIRPVFEAVNTLEAMRRHSPVNTLFEALCSPRASDGAMALYESYCRSEFGKRAMMRHIFGDEAYEEFEKGEAADRLAANANPTLFGADRDTVLLFFAVIGLVLMLIVIGYAVVTVVIKDRTVASSALRGGARAAAQAARKAQEAWTDPEF
uniref:Uncharacterized protein n=1 Tax=Chrysotila carterae TaxID=13221 RepID=A0A7S4BN81_CHRCT|mmetsp:Transcript_32597/g.71560  ORF Transcript_32597/g.71560 Transcript_32597/m.71560 type:complete len:304 (+) Transcript_32597:580-1491(+)